MHACLDTPDGNYCRLGITALDCCLPSYIIFVLQLVIIFIKYNTKLQAEEFVTRGGPSGIYYLTVLCPELFPFSRHNVILQHLEQSVSKTLHWPCFYNYHYYYNNICSRVHEVHRVDLTSKDFSHPLWFVTICLFIFRFSQEFFYRISNSFSSFGFCQGILLMKMCWLSVGRISTILINYLTESCITTDSCITGKRIADSKSER